MEENKKKMSANVKKPSYEELNNYVNELMMSNRDLRERLNQVMGVQNKLPYLFEIIKYKDIFGEEYSKAAINEIKFIIPAFDASKINSEKDNNSEDTETSENIETK